MRGGEEPSEAKVHVVGIGEFGVAVVCKIVGHNDKTACMADNLMVSVIAGLDTK